MTPKDKINLLNAHGRKWGEIADIIGVSRQFLSRVRSGEKNLSAQKLKILDGLVADYVNYDGNQSVTHDVNQEVVKEHPAEYSYAQEISKLRADIEELKLDVQVIKKLIIK